MPSITAQELIDRAAAAADMHDDFVTGTQWYRWMTVENRALAVKIAQLGYVLVEDFVDIPATGALEYNIDEPLAILGVYEVSTNNLLRRVRAVSPVDGHYQTANTVTGPAGLYHIRRQPPGGDDTLVTMTLFPNPTSGTYRVYFIPHPVALTAGSDTVGYPLGWEERIVLGMARRALAKEESSTEEIEKQIRQTDSDIEAAVWGRLLGDSPTIRNTDPQDIGAFSAFPYPWPSVSSWFFV